MSPGAGLEQASPLARRVPERATHWLFVAIALMPLVPLWCFSHFPSQDGPAHLEIAVVLRELFGSSAGPFARYFAINTAPEPNWLIYPVLMLLERAFAPDVAEKVLISLYLLALPLSMLYAMRALRPVATPVAFLGLPLALNYPLHMGFYNFAFGLAAFFLLVGYHARCDVPMTARQALRLGLLLLLAYFCHAVALAMALLAIGCAILEDCVGARSSDPDRARRLLRAAMRLGLAAAPSLLLLATFVASDNGPSPPPMSLLTLARQLGVLYSLVSFGTAEIAVSATLGLVLAAITTVALLARFATASPRWGQMATGDGLLVATGATTALYFLVPAGLAGGGYVNQRLQLFIVFFILLWLCTRPEMDRHHRIVMAAGAVLAIASAALHGVHYARIAGYLDEYQSAAAVLDPGSTVLPVSFDHRGAGPGRPLSRRVFPFEHAAGRVAAQRRLIDLNSFQASRGYFPIVYRPECDPLRRLGTAEELGSDWPTARLDGYADAPGCSIDQVVVWAAGAEAHARNPLLLDLDRSFERVFVSRRGLVEVYRRSGSRSASASDGSLRANETIEPASQSAAQR